MEASIKDEQLISIMTEYFNEQIPFNKVLGIKVDSMSSESVSASLQMREELLGHYARRMLHGGVISSIIDITGGLSAVMSIKEDTADDNPKTRREMADRVSTIDLRVDFLRPATGERFVAKAYPLRTGKRIAVIRTELRNDQENLVAAGTSTYVTN
ncbi:MAG: thioesterase family protein [Syntrophorhabdus sp.]